MCRRSHRASTRARRIGGKVSGLIEAAGAKGYRFGTAEVSEKHANFIQADEGGSADDVRALPASPTATEPVVVPELETGSGRPLPDHPLPDQPVEGADVQGGSSAEVPPVVDEGHSESLGATEPPTSSAATDSAIAPSQTLPPKAPREEALHTDERVEEPTPVQESAGSEPDEAKLDLHLEPRGEASSNPLAGERDTDLAHLFDTGEHTTFDWRTPTEGRGDQGPHTQPVAAARFEEEPDDAFLAELRRAMHDNEPLGPDGSAKG